VARKDISLGGSLISGRVMKQIDPYVVAIEEHELDLDWEEICDRVPGLQGKDSGYLPRRSLQLLVIRPETISLRS
jgi:hypothetical protein